MIISTIIKIAFRNIWRNKRRTGFCLAAVGVSVFFFVFFLSMQDGLNKNMNNTIQVYEMGHIRIVSAQYEAEHENMPVQYPILDGKNWSELASSIHEIHGVCAVFPRITTRATLLESRIKHAVLLGIDIKAETTLNHFNFVNKNNGLVEGRYPAPDTNECAIGITFARKAGLSIGDRLPLKTISAQFSERFWSPIVTGIFSFDYPKFDEQVIVTDFKRLQRLLTLGDGTQQLIIFANDEKQSQSIAVNVQNILGENVVITPWNDTYWIAGQKTSNTLYMIVYLIFLVVASFLIINTITMIIHERSKEIGMMGCLGLTRFEIVQVFFFESLFLAIIGASCGVIVGGILTGILANFPLHLGNLYSGTPVSNTVFFKFCFERILQAWLLGVVVTSIFTLIPSLKSAFIEPVEALRR